MLCTLRLPMRGLHRTQHILSPAPHAMNLQAMRDAAAALQRARPSAAVYDRRRKVEWALRLQQRWLRWVEALAGSALI